MKLLTLLLILLFLPVALAAECDIGIDNYCDPDCLSVDFDCLENEEAGIQDVFCEPIVDGYCDPRCPDVDWDCIQSGEERFEEISLDENDSFVSVEPTLLPDFVDEADDSPAFIWLVIIGILLFSGLTGLIYWRYSQHHEEEKFKDILPLARISLEKGYSFAQIRSALRSKGYDEEFINEFLKTLEKRP